MMRVAETIHTAYWNALSDVLHEPEYICSPRGQKCFEKSDYIFRVLYPVDEPIKTYDEERNKVIADYTAKETELYDSCTNRVEDFAKASSFWKKLANPDGTVNSAYGYLIWKKRSAGNRFENFIDNGHGGRYEAIMRTPWEWAKESLLRDKDTRQAILRFSLPEHQWVGNKDFTCTMNGVFQIRDNKLNFSVNMRSNDLMKGLVFDLPWFVSLMDKMIEELKSTYPELEKGHYTHAANSMHIYERDFEAVSRMLGEQ